MACTRCWTAWATWTTTTHKARCWRSCGYRDVPRAPLHVHKAFTHTCMLEHTKLLSAVKGSMAGACCLLLQHLIMHIQSKAGISDASFLRSWKLPSLLFSPFRGPCGIGQDAPVCCKSRQEQTVLHLAAFIRGAEQNRSLPWSHPA